VYIYGSYRKNKTGAPFLDHHVDDDATLLGYVMNLQ